MFVFLVTGPSGAGKSTLARRMAAWGHHTLNADADPALSAWTDHAGHRVDRPAHPTADWLANHEWRFVCALAVSRLSSVPFLASTATSH